MKRAGHIVANVFTLGIFGFVRKIVENRRAVRAGLPKPHDPAGLVGEAVGIGLGAAAGVAKNQRARELLELSSDLLQDEDDDEPTPAHRPSAKHRGLR